jgi:nicotinamidase-related amidase
MPVPRLTLDRTAVLVVDVQERIVPVMHNAESLVRQACRLLDGAAVLGLPVLWTEQYPQGLGATVPVVRERVAKNGMFHEKLTFSACIEPVREELVRRGIRSVLVCGIETHVCVLQTCLDLVDHGFLPGLVKDAVGSRRVEDEEVAFKRMIHVGVVPTTVEGALLEMAHEASGDRFRKLLQVLK